MFFFLSSSSSSSGFLSGPCNVDESTRNPKKNEKRNQILKKNRKKEPTESRSGSVGERSVRSRLLFLFCWNFLLFYLIFDFFFFRFRFIRRANAKPSWQLVFCFFFVVVVPVETHENPIKNEATPKKTR